VRRGHLRVDPGRTRYKLRLKAVPYSVVGQLWPITTFRRWLMRREARFQLMRLGYSPNYMRGDYSRQIKLRLAGVEDVGNIIET
jgi:hypothetical protein